MTASLHRLGAGSQAGLYYTNDSAREARPDRRDEYYLSEGGGRWVSTGETVVRNGAAIDARSFRDLCAGRDPRSGAALVRGAGEGHWAGLDVTMTPGKSVSVLWAAGDMEQRARIEAAHRNAVDRALRFVVDEGLVLVRSGAGGHERHRPDDLIIGVFDHYTTRDGDPNLHSHCVLVNVAGAPASARSGRYKHRHLTIDPEQVFHWKLTIGAAYRAELASELHNAFGLAFRPAGKGQWEIAGVPSSVLARFSQRSAAIEERVGPNATPAQREIAALATRRGKDRVPTGSVLETLWHQALSELAADPWADAHSYDRSADKGQRRDDVRGRPFDPPEIPSSSPVAAAASDLFHHENVLGRKPLLQASLERASLDGIGVDAVEDELKILEHDSALVPLRGTERAQCWTTPGIASTEAAMLRAADRFDEADWFKADALEAALARSPHLAAEQAQAVRHAANRDGVALLEAGAGTGKTTTLEAVVRGAHESGLTVLGLAPSWVAADEMRKAAGIDAHAIARWRHDRQKGRARALDNKSVVIIDEAGMVSTRDMAAVLGVAQEAGAKVLLVGDRRQLASVAGGSALRAVADVLERSAVLEHVRRQQVDWQRAASMLMARGDAEAGLRAYASQGRVELVAGEEPARERTIAIWTEQRAIYGDDVMIVTRRNRDSTALNARARSVLRAEGKLGDDMVSLLSVNREDDRVDLLLAVGDQLRFGETLPHLNVRNGNRAVVEAVLIAPNTEVQVRLRLEDGRVFDRPWSTYAREPRFGRRQEPPRIVHGYAGTAYAAQGRTAETAVVHIQQATDAREVYVALTRHRRDARLVVEQERLDALCRQRQADPRQTPTTAAMLEVLFREAGQYAEKANVIDYAQDRVGFIQDGRLRLREPEAVLDVARAIRAARSLKDALMRLGTDLIVIPAWRLSNDIRRQLRTPNAARVRQVVQRVTEHLSTEGRVRKPDRSQGLER